MALLTDSAAARPARLGDGDDDVIGT